MMGLLISSRAAASDTAIASIETFMFETNGLWAEFVKSCRKR